MKRLIALIALVCALVAAAEPADSVATIADRLNAGGSIIVVQPDALNRLLVPVVAAETSQPSGDSENVEIVKPSRSARAGYRIMVFDDNNVRTAKSAAQARKSQVQSRFPQHRVYVVFDSPYWRVKVGDFRTRGEAEAVMAEIRAAFPGMSSSLRIVRDRINAGE